MAVVEVWRGGGGGSACKCGMSYFDCSVAAAFLLDATYCYFDIASYASYHWGSSTCSKSPDC